MVVKAGILGITILYIVTFDTPPVVFPKELQKKKWDYPEAVRTRYDYYTWNSPLAKRNLDCCTE